MKKTNTIIFILCLLFGVQCVSVSAMETAPIYLEGTKINFSVSPYISEGYLMVPIRQISEAVNAPVFWNDKRQAATIIHDKDELVLQAGKKYAVYNGIRVPLPIAPQIKDNRAFLPLRYVAEWLQMRVEFKNGSAYVESQKITIPIDTLQLAKGNSNGNLNCGGKMVVWQDCIYFPSAFVSGLVCQKADGEQRVIRQGDFSHFNIYQNVLYGIYNGDFVSLNDDMTINKKLVENVSYGQIQDGWLYYIHNDSSEKRLFRLSLKNGTVEDLNIKNLSQIVITDQHIYVYVTDAAGKAALLRAALDGSDRQKVIALDSLTALDYSDGYLYFNLGYGEAARVCRIKTDGSQLQQLSDWGAEQINMIDDRIYFSRLEQFYVSDNGSQDWVGRNICRMGKDGSDFQQITLDAPVTLQSFGSPMVYHGKIFYEDKMIANYQIWKEID